MSTTTPPTHTLCLSLGRWRLPLGGLLLPALALTACASPAPRHEFPAASTLPAQAAMPDPIVMLDGQRVSSRAQWFEQRQPELAAKASTP